MHRHGRGFTLLELLIVLALIAIAVTLAIASVDQLAGRVAERRWSDLTQQTLTRLRNQAVMGGAVIKAVVDFKNGEIALVAEDARQVLTLPERYQFIPVAGDAPVAPVNFTLPLYFFPDGTMEEAVFDLRLPTQGVRRYRLSRYTGKIEQTHVVESTT